MSGVFQNIAPTPSLPGECVPPRLLCGGRTPSLGGEGVGGHYFGRRQTQLCTLHIICKYFVDFSYIFEGRIRGSEAAMDGGGAQRPVWVGSELKKTGARSARARTRGQNPLVLYTYSHREGARGGR